MYAMYAMYVMYVLSALTKSPKTAKLAGSFITLTFVGGSKMEGKPGQKSGV
jgi:hypothetical protein